MFIFIVIIICNLVIITYYYNNENKNTPTYFTKLTGDYIPINLFVSSFDLQVL